MDEQAVWPLSYSEMMTVGPSAPPMMPMADVFPGERAKILDAHTFENVRNKPLAANIDRRHEPTFASPKKAFIDFDFLSRAVTTEVTVERALIKDLVFFLQIKTSSYSRARATRRRAVIGTDLKNVSACRSRAAFLCGQRATARRLCRLYAPRTPRSFRA